MKQVVAEWLLQFWRNMHPIWSAFESYGSDVPATSIRLPACLRRYQVAEPTGLALECLVRLVREVLHNYDKYWLPTE